MGQAVYHACKECFLVHSSVFCSDLCDIEVSRAHTGALKKSLTKLLCAFLVLWSYLD